MKLYIAGPMTGLPDFNRPAFNVAQAKLEAAGYDVLNPARQPDGLEYAEYMARSRADISQCDGIALLKGWEASPGARHEVRCADGMRLDASELDVWLMISLTRSEPSR